MTSTTGSTAPAFSLRIREAYSGVPVTDAKVALCSGADTDCAAPLARAAADATGIVTLPIAPTASDAAAFVLVTGSEIATHYVLIAGRAPSAGTIVVDVDVYIPPALEAMAQLAGVPWDPAMAIVRVDARDCGGAPAEDVAVSIGSNGGAGAVVSYLNGQGSPTRANSGTDATGIAVVFDVPAGDFGAAALFQGQSAGGALAVAHPGAVTSVVLRP